MYFHPRTRLAKKLWVWDFICTNLLGKTNCGYDNEIHVWSCLLRNDNDILAFTARFESNQICFEITPESKMSTQITKRLTCRHILRYDKSHFGYHSIFVSDHVCLEMTKKFYLQFEKNWLINSGYDSEIRVWPYLKINDKQTVAMTVWFVSNHVC